MDAHSMLLRSGAGFPCRAAVHTRAFTSCWLRPLAAVEQPIPAKTGHGRRRWGCARLPAGQNRARVARRRAVCTHASLQSQLLGVGLFFTPGMLALAYAFVKGKGNLRDGLSRLLTEVWLYARPRALSMKPSTHLACASRTLHPVWDR